MLTVHLAAVVLMLFVQFFTALLNALADEVQQAQVRH
jgi:hypothetical protein